MRQLEQSSVSGHSRAWSYVVLNLLAFPGMGTIMARRTTGYLQATLSLIGFGMFVGFVLWFMVGLVRTAGDMSGDLDAYWRFVRSRAWIAWAGLVVCAVAWFWSLFSSVQILRAARRNSRPPPLP